ncbi:glutamate receptor ionotropic, kainate 2 [Bombyx mori]|uniref:glutamate receptor ionotropic, kainate 2 n=1 Tax=Bombyx mori TaxID=7091 RepID=UPI0006409D30
MGGLFNGLTLPSSVRVFEKMVQKSSTGFYHGRSLESSVIDSYSISLEMCPFTSDNHGIAALIDARPTDGICDTICLLCNRYNVSHLSIGWETTETLPTDLFTFQYHPPPDLISKAYIELIKFLQWDKFTILYESEKSFKYLEEIINNWGNPNEPILFRKLDPEGDNREAFKELIKVAHMNYHIIILDCHFSNVHKYMMEITQVENSTEYLSFILTSLNAYSLNFHEIPALMANVSTLHLTTHINDVKWKDLGINTDNEPIQLETALVADAINHVGKAIRGMMGDSRSFNFMNIPPPPELCVRGSKTDYEEVAWPLGNELRAALTQTTIKGFTGFIDFDEFGKRKNFHLHFSKLDGNSRFVSAGSWDSRTNIITTERIVNDRSKVLKPNSKIRIATKKDLPYFEIVENSNGTFYRGFVVDLIEAIFKQIKNETNIELEYEFYKVADNKLGNPIPESKKWDGIIGDLIEHKAELGVADLTVTAERLAAVDFSTPFMVLGVSMLFKQTEPPPPDMFSFMKPLSLDVWLYLATTFIVISFILLICARMSLDDWVNPHPCNLEPENLQNIWSLYNCMWLNVGAIMTQGCDILPRGPGSRWVVGMWWFFSMIVTASYMANMSTFMRNNRRNNDIEDVKALSEQTKVSYGAVQNSATYKLFKNSNDTIYKKISMVMDTSRPSVFTLSNEDGVNRVLKGKGKYAFFMESSAIDYYTKRHCNLKMVGPKLDSKEYGIAMPKNFPRRSLIDHAILSLQQIGELTRLKTKWWEIEDNVAHCENIKSDGEQDIGSLQMANTSGIFLVLGVGGILGLFVAIIEFLLYIKKMSAKDGVTFYEALIREWRVSLNPRELHKQAAPPGSAIPASTTPSTQGALS